jgi:hypothetical protein
VNEQMWGDYGNVTPLRGFDKEALKRELPLDWVLYRAGVDLRPDSSGTRLEGYCPFGQHNGPKFTVRTTETGEQVAGCWACPDKQQGDLFELVRWLYNEPADGPFGVLLQHAGVLSEQYKADAAWKARPPVVLKPAEKTDPAVFSALASAAFEAACSDPTLLKVLIERKAATDPGWRRITPEYLINTWRVGVEPDRTETRGVSNPDATPYDSSTTVKAGTRVIVPHYSWSDEHDAYIARAVKTRNAAYGHLFAALGSDLKASLYGVWRMTGKDWVLVCEGEGDAWCAGAVPELAGGMDIVSVSSGVKGMPKPEYLAPLAGRNVILAFDGDTDGRYWAGKWVEALGNGLASSVWVVPTPDEQDLASAPDLLGLVQMAQKVTDVADSAPEASGDARPVLVLGEPQDNLHWLWDELGTGGLSGMFLRGDQLVHTAAVGEDGYSAPADDRDSDGPYQVRGVTAVGLAARVSDAYQIIKPSSPGRPVFPKSLSEMALSYLDRAPNLRNLRGVTHVPMPRADGTLITEPGFDRESGYLYLPTLEVPPIPEQVTGEPVAWATRYLEYLVAEFRWAGEHDKANFFGMLLTPLLRLLTPPPYKFGIIGAHQPGSGKSLLSSIITTVHGGVFRAEMPSDGAELEKLLLSILLTTTAPVVLFDNLSGTVRSSHLAGLLTSADYSGRVLGATHNASVPNNRLWIGNGNNVALGGDMPRRTLWSMIDPGIPDPHLKTFALNIPEFLRTERNNVLRALLIWIEHWRSVGGVVPSIAGDSYSVWVATVREILSAAGVSGVFDHTESVQQVSGTDDDGWAELVQFVHEVTCGQPWTVKQLLAWCEQDLLQTNPLHDRLLEVLPDDLQRKIGHSGRLSAVTKSLGRWLANRDGRWANGYSIKCVSKDRDGLKHWTTYKYSE